MISHLLSTGSDTGRWIRGFGWPTLAAWIAIWAGGLAIAPRPCWPASDSLSTAAPGDAGRRAAIGPWSSPSTPEAIRRAVRGLVRVDRLRARREGEPFSPLALVDEGGEVFAWCCGHRRACLPLVGGALEASRGLSEEVLEELSAGERRTVPVRRPARACPVDLYGSLPVV